MSGPNLAKLTPPTPSTCSCLGCTCTATRFVGGNKIWLRFCSKAEHREAAFAWNQYLFKHPNARAKGAVLHARNVTATSIGAAVAV